MPQSDKDKIGETILLLDGITLDPLPNYGDLMLLNDFVSYCKTGMFIGYDGTGYYATKNGMSRRHRAFPAVIKSGEVDRRFTHVMWFNR